MRKAYADTGIIGLAELDAEAIVADDNRVADEFDARQRAELTPQYSRSRRWPESARADAATPLGY